MLVRVIKKKLIVDVAIELPIRIMGSGAIKFEMSIKILRQEIEI